jgi:hypothetical protein
MTNNIKKGKKFLCLKSAYVATIAIFALEA